MRARQRRDAEREERLQDSVPQTRKRKREAFDEPFGSSSSGITERPEATLSDMAPEDESWSTRLRKRKREVFNEPFGSSSSGVTERSEATLADMAPEESWSTRLRKRKRSALHEPSGSSSRSPDGLAEREEEVNYSLQTIQNIRNSPSRKKGRLSQAAENTISKNMNVWFRTELKDLEKNFTKHSYELEEVPPDSLKAHKGVARRLWRHSDVRSRQMQRKKTNKRKTMIQGRNVARLNYTVRRTGQNLWMTATSNYGYHSERRISIKLVGLYGRDYRDKLEFHELYTDRAPCHGNGMHKCADKLNVWFPGLTKVYYLFEYPGSGKGGDHISEEEAKRRRHHSSEKVEAFDKHLSEKRTAKGFSFQR